MPVRRSPFALQLEAWWAGAGWLLLAAGLFTAAYLAGASTYRNAIAAHRSRTWPTVQGTVLSSTTVELSGGKGRVTYQARIEYSYVFAAQSHQGNRIRFGQGSPGDQDSADSLVASMPRRSTVPVAVNPAEPEQSVLIPGSFLPTNWLAVPFSLIFVIAGFGALIVALLNLTWRPWR